MIRGTTDSGFLFELEDEALDDYELLDALVRVDKGETHHIFTAVDKLLGKEQCERLKEHVRTESGRVPASLMVRETMEIFSSCGKTKN